jgi:hypothetical protein
LLTYRDFLLQRFHRIEAGKVRMTTNLAVDLAELFVMPRVLPRQPKMAESPTGELDASVLLNLMQPAASSPSPPGVKTQARTSHLGTQPSTN